MTITTQPTITAEFDFVYEDETVEQDVVRDFDAWLRETFSPLFIQQELRISHLTDSVSSHPTVLVEAKPGIIAILNAWYEHIDT